MDQQRWREILLFLQENQLMESNNVKVILALSRIYRATNELAKAREVIERGLQKHALHADIHHQAGIIYFMLGQYQKSLHHLFFAQRLDAEKKEDQEILFTIISAQQQVTEEEFDKIYMDTIYLIQNFYEKFPLKSFKSEEKELENYVGDFFSINEKEYWVGEYGKNLAPENTKEPATVAVEMLLAKKVNTLHLDCTEETIIPVMPLSSNPITLRYNKDSLQIKDIDVGKYHYYTIPKETKVDIYTEDQSDFVVGQSIVNKVSDTEKPKLVLNLFVDGLSQLFLSQEGLEQVMPNTAKFFGKGTICTRAYTVGEWTYPSMANYFTGLYTMNHRMYHPKINSNQLYTLPLFTEAFSNQGYFCTYIGNNARATPVHGYAKGMHRCLYQYGIYGFDTGKVVEEIVESLSAFSSQNQWLYAQVFDLHAVPKAHDSYVSTDVHVPLQYRERDLHSSKSVHLKYHKGRIELYRAMCTRIDRLLGMLYDYITSNYQEDEYIVSLFSDHGQSFLTQSQIEFDDGRLKIPMMFRGKNIPVGVCEELVQSLDLFPILLQSMGENPYPFSHDGNVPKYFGGEREREYAFCESVYPGEGYFSVFYEKERKFSFVLKEILPIDGRLPFIDYDVKVIDLQTDEDVTGRYEKEIKRYKNILNQHVADYYM